MSALQDKYRVACKEADRLESLLNRGHLKSLQDWRRLSNARHRRDELAAQLAEEKAG